jgi:hypothetical protein
MSRITRSLATTSFASLFAAVVLIAGLSPAISRLIEPFGARGDASHQDSCPPGQYLTGARVRSGAWVDQVSIRCQPLSGNTSSVFYGPARGGNGGGPGEGHCPDGNMIRWMFLDMTAGNRQVMRFVFRCEVPTDRSKFFALRVGSLAQAAGSSPIQYCLDGEAATGLATRHGKHVNAAGLICDKLVK